MKIVIVFSYHKHHVKNWLAKSDIKTQLVHEETKKYKYN
jgi:hypothetical protein